MGRKVSHLSEKWLSALYSSTYNRIWVKTPSGDIRQTECKSILSVYGFQYIELMKTSKDTQGFVWATQMKDEKQDVWDSESRGTYFEYADNFNSANIRF